MSYINGWKFFGLLQLHKNFEIQSLYKNKKGFIDVFSITNKLKMREWGLGLYLDTVTKNISCINMKMRNFMAIPLEILSEI